jgi:hypothetical protein
METKKITYSKKWFNPLFFILEDIVLNMPKVKRVLVYGGKSSAKTASISQLIAKRGVERGESSILFRKESSRVKTTIKKSFELGINTTRLSEGWRILDREFRSITGANVVLTGLDNEDKAKGVEGFNFVLFDELDQFDEQEYRQTNLSLRGEGRKVFFGTWNPVSKESWVKKNLVDSYEWKETSYKLPSENSFVKISSCLTTILVKTMYKDNFFTVGSPCKTYGFIDQNLIDDYEALKNNPNRYNDYLVNVLGEWGNVRRGGEFYKGFSIEKNVVSNKYDENLPLHICFDENVNSYLSLSVYQAKGLESWKIDEICLQHPLNTLKDTLNKLTAKYTTSKQTVFVYGDRTSLKQDTKLEKGQNFFTIIEDYLRLKGYLVVMRLPRRNPSVILRGNFINEILALNIYDIKYTISENCIKTIDDFQNVKEASDGTKHKEKTKNKLTGVTYEKYGHLTDTDDYFLCEYYKTEFEKYCSPIKKKRRSLGSMRI